jgi:hypothetical protein
MISQFPILEHVSRIGGDMDIAEAKEFLKGKEHGVLVVRKKDGSLQMTLVSPVMSANGDLIITSRETTYKVKNINYIQVDGRAEIIPQPQAMDIILDWHRQIRGEPENWDDIRKKTIAERRIAIRINIEMVGPQKRG